MSDQLDAADNDVAKYRIGAVCRLTGLSQHVLRMWEKRYAVVEPERGENQRRLYRDSDVNRLSLLKALVDRGQAIGSIADLDTGELEKRLQQFEQPLRLPTEGDKPKLVLVGETLSLNPDSCADSEVFESCGHFADLDSLQRRDPALRLDVAVIAWPTLHIDAAIDSTRLANQLNLRHLVLVYDYAPRVALARLPRSRITALRSPLDLAALEAVIAWRFGFVGRRDVGAPEPAAQRRFNDHELAHLAAQSSAIACECPMHLAQLITTLVRFEDYSAECESRNAEDAELHAYLHDTTAHARGIMERALARVVEFEKLEILPRP